MAEATLFHNLKSAAADDWGRYTHHAFLGQLADGSLPEAAFRHYLIQDYLFLIQFARAYALAVYKSDSLAEMRMAADGMSAILDVEMDLHVEYCAGWGIDAAAMARTPEAPACLAYTRYVLERGAAGDLLDLHVALAPCIVGYAEIGARLAADPATRRDGNPYSAWIEMYAGDEYQAVAMAEIEFIDELMGRRGGAGRMPALRTNFAIATRLEIDFWQMGLDTA
jgi:thiaminase/transcriptional activator TenA